MWLDCSEREPAGGKAVLSPEYNDIFFFMWLGCPGSAMSDPDRILCHAYAHKIRYILTPRKMPAPKVLDMVDVKMNIYAHKKGIMVWKLNIVHLCVAV